MPSPLKSASWTQVCVGTGPPAYCLAPCLVNARTSEAPYIEFIFRKGAVASTQVGGVKLRLFGAAASYCESKTINDVAGHHVPAELPTEIRSGAPSPLKSARRVRDPVPSETFATVQPLVV